MSKDTNTGNRNSGDWNSGDWNSGDGNSGDWNSGDWNSGDWNSGNWNSGNRNSTSGSSGIFCSEEPTVILFNKDSGKKWGEIDHPHFCEFYLNKWIPWLEMTAVEKKENPSAETTEGYLKTYSYQEAWTNFWEDTDEDNRKKFLNLPNFDAATFKEITGIDVSVNSEKEELLKKANELIKKAEEIKAQARKL
jgi:Pentapeptide repeats (8 copies)